MIFNVKYKCTCIICSPLQCLFASPKIRFFPEKIKYYTNILSYEETRKTFYMYMVATTINIKIAHIN